MTSILDISAVVTCLLHVLDFMCILGLGLVATCLRWVLTSGWDSMVGPSPSTSAVSNGWRDLAPLRLWVRPLRVKCRLSAVQETLLNVRDPGTQTSVDGVQSSYYMQCTAWFLEY